QAESIRRGAGRPDPDEQSPLLRGRGIYAGKLELSGKHRPAAVLRQIRRRVRPKVTERDVPWPGRRAADAEAERVCAMGLRAAGVQLRGLRRQSGQPGQYAHPARCAGRGAHVGARIEVPERVPLQLRAAVAVPGARGALLLQDVRFLDRAVQWYDADLRLPELYVGQR